VTTYAIEVRVRLKESVFDPQGHTVESALTSHGYAGVHGVRIGKYMQLSIEAENEASAHEQVKKICEEVLCNPVMETYAYTLKVGATV
jgi:phosphoribosylformylglycinamidine synthase subunit PurS